MPTILLVDDEPGILNIMQMGLERASLQTLTAASGAEALALFKENDVDLMVVDLRLGGKMDGLEVMHECKAWNRALPVVMITAYGTIEVAVQAMKQGAVDFVTKPFDLETLMSTVTSALQQSRAATVPDTVDGEGPTAHFGSIIGESPEMHRMYSVIERVGPTEATTLIEGESGTGKELVARAIHDVSSRREGAWVPVNCAAIPAQLLESELFGHAKGAFTGASHDRRGLFEAASGGTIFLDEIGVMDINLQGKLLRTLQESKVRPVGTNYDRPVNTRVIAATNESLEARKDSGQFRDDLYYRLSVIPIVLPPLRRRPGDIALLARFFLSRQSKALQQDIVFDDGVLETLGYYGWPGNIRELENAIACATTLCQDGVVRIKDLPPNISCLPDETVPAPPDAQAYDGKTLRQFLREQEQRYMELVLNQTGGNRARAADMLGISRATFYRKSSEAAESGEEVNSSR